MVHRVQGPPGPAYKSVLKGEKTKMLGRAWNNLYLSSQWTYWLIHKWKVAVKNVVYFWTIHKYYFFMEEVYTFSELKKLAEIFWFRQ